MSTPKIGGASVRVAAAVADAPSSLATDGTRVYWSEVPAGGSGVLWSSPVGGGSPKIVTQGPTVMDVGGLAVDATDLYWTLGIINDGAVYGVPTGGGTMTTLATGQQQPGPIVVDSANVYWANVYSIMKYPKPAGPAVALATALSARVMGIAVDATYVYWTQDNGLVLRTPIAGGTPQTLASGESGPAELAVDGVNLYWSAAGQTSWQGSVRRMPLLGGSGPTTLIDGLGLPGSISVDATRVYVAELASGAWVMSIAPK
jgi:hypothetical protein